MIALEALILVYFSGKTSGRMFSEVQVLLELKYKIRRIAEST